MASSFIGGGVPAVDSSEPHTSVSETPAPIKSLEPPASNSGSADPTGGISKEAGGLSSSAGIGSPVTAEHERQTVVGSVLEYAFGKKERTAEEVEASAPTTSSVAADSSTPATTESSGTYLGAIAAAGGAAVASIIPGMASTTGAQPGATSGAESTTAAKEPVSSTEQSTWVSAGPNTTSTSGEKSLTEKAAETTEAAKVSASETADSAAKTATAAGEQVKEAVTGEKSGETEEETEEQKKAKKVSDHEAAVRENKDAIPTAGGEKLGAAHAGESKVIPDVPKAPKEESKVSSSAGQPDSTTADNTAKNAGGDQHHIPVLGGRKDSEEGSSDKPKFMDRLKNKLHIGDKKDKA